MVTQTGNQSETGKTNTSLNHDGKRWNKQAAKPLLGKEGRKVEFLN
jgi:hypothetical protein